MSQSNVKASSKRSPMTYIGAILIVLGVLVYLGSGQPVGIVLLWVGVLLNVAGIFHTGRMNKKASQNDLETTD